MSDEDLGWAIVEGKGFRRLAGYVSEQQVAGASFLRVEVPAAAGRPAVTQLYNPSSIHCLTPTSEETAREAAGLAWPAPVSRWELPEPEPPTPAIGTADDDDDLDDFDRMAGAY